LLWVLLAFGIMMVLQFPFIFFFDTMLTDIGFLYLYFFALPQAIILYFTAFRLRVRWTSTVMLGINGLIGAPVDYYFDWVVQQNLISPIYAFMWTPLYIITGMAADISLMKLHPERWPIRASLISAFMFTAAVIATTVFATYSFYPQPLTLDVPWIREGNFLLPYPLVTGAMGGYLGYTIARDVEASQRNIP
jgi:hypothetical protein